MLDDHDTLLAREDDTNWQRQRIDLDELSGAVARRGFDYWTQLRGTRRLVPRSEIRPRAIAQILRNTLIVRVLGEGDDFEYRVAGDAVIQLHGPWLPNSTTADLDKHFSGYGRLVKRVYLHVFRSGEPLALRGEVLRQPRNENGIGTLFKHETVFVPLGETDNAVDHIMAFCDVVGELWQPRQRSHDRLFSILR